MARFSLSKAQIAALATVTAAFRDDMDFLIERPDPYSSGVDVRMRMATIFGETCISVEHNGDWATISPEGEIIANGKPRDLFRMIATGQVSEG